MAKKDKKEARMKKKEEKLKKLKERKASKKKTEMKKEKVKKVDNPNAKIKKHHVWGLAGIIAGIIIALLIVTLFSVKYVTHQKKESYIEGGRDALREVFNSVNSQGGLILNFEGESVIIAKYNKESDSSVEENSTS